MESWPPTRRGCTFAQTVFNVVNVMLGTGVLSLPHALSLSGWAGLLILWSVALVANRTGHALVDCAKRIDAGTSLPLNQNQHHHTYESVALAAFGPLGKSAMASFVYMEYFGACCIFFLLQGKNLYGLLGGWGATQTQCMVLAALSILPTVWLPDMSALSRLAATGMASMAVITMTVLASFIFGGHHSSTDLFVGPSLPKMVGICAYCYNGHGIFLSIQASMQNPSKFPQVLNLSFMLVTLVCTIIASTGYFMFGRDAADVLIFNLSGLPQRICSIAILINPLTMFGITMEPISAALARNTEPLPKPIGRTLLAGFIMLSAYKFPVLVDIMSVLGCLMTMSVCITFPTLCQLVICRNVLDQRQVILRIFLLLVSCTFTVLGTAVSSRSLFAGINKF